MLASFSISPVGVGESLSTHVAGMLDIIDKSGLPYKLGAMQTTVEGPEDEVVLLIMRGHHHMLAKAHRVLTHIAIDDREGAKGRLTGKVASVEKALGRRLAHE